LTEYDARKLQFVIARKSDASAKRELSRYMRCEPAWALGVVLKCVVCLLILARLALIGNGTVLQPETRPNDSGAGRLVQHRERPSVVEARKAFDERRNRFEKKSTGPPAHAAPDQALPAAP
jgi:hypothetical protein